MAGSPRLGEASICVAREWRAIPSWSPRARSARAATPSRCFRLSRTATWRCSLAAELAAAALLLGGCLFPGAEEEAHSAERRPPVVFVVFDEFPADDLLRPDGTIDAERFPNFAELASISSWFPNATTVYDSTFGAVPAILDGRLPRPREAADVRSHKPSIFTEMDRLGYAVVKVESGTAICPQAVGPGARTRPPRRLPPAPRCAAAARRRRAPGAVPPVGGGDSQPPAAHLLFPARADAA